MKWINAAIPWLGTVGGVALFVTSNVNEGLIVILATVLYTFLVSRPRTLGNVPALLSARRPTPTQVRGYREEHGGTIGDALRALDRGAP